MEFKTLYDVISDKRLNHLCANMKDKDPEAFDKWWKGFCNDIYLSTLDEHYKNEKGE